jgi:hypothetical protein
MNSGKLTPIKALGTPITIFLLVATANFRDVSAADAASIRQRE